jgi:hypothetical protein
VYTIQLSNPPTGIAAESVDEGDSVNVYVSAFMSDADGAIFYKSLAFLQNLFLNHFVHSGGHVSVIDHFLVTMRGNQANVYVNELGLVLETMSRTARKAGEVVTRDDILGVRSLKFQNLLIGNDEAIIFYFSSGWRRGLFFDLRPNDGGQLDNLELTLGTFYESLMYADVFDSVNDIWQEIFDLGWFPFLRLVGDTLSAFQSLASRIADEKSIEKAERVLVESFGEKELRQIENDLRSSSFFQPHINILVKGIERYLDGDYISSINNVWPRVEGVLRYMYKNNQKSVKKESIRGLLSKLETEFARDKQTFPGIAFSQQFKAYLDSYYFRDFDLFNEELQISRHSIGHGVSDQCDYDRKKALLGILIIDQLRHYIMLSSRS